MGASRHDNDILIIEYGGRRIELLVMNNVEKGGRNALEEIKKSLASGEFCVESTTTIDLGD